MTMNKITGLIFFDEFDKDPETPMAGVFRIMDKSRRGMGDNQIDAPAAPQGKTHFPDKPGHLFLGILIDIAVIPP